MPVTNYAFRKKIEITKNNVELVKNKLYGLIWLVNFDLLNQNIMCNFFSKQIYFLCLLAVGAKHVFSQPQLLCNFDSIIHLLLLLFLTMTSNYYFLDEREK